jgi:hypothetical protein
LTMRRRQRQQLLRHLKMAFKTWVGARRVADERWQIEDRGQPGQPWLAAQRQRGRSKRAGFGRLFALDRAGMFLPFVALAQDGFRKGGGGAILLTQARQDGTRQRPAGNNFGALIHHQPDRSASRARGADVGGACYREIDTSVAFAGRVRCRRSLRAARSSAAARNSMSCAALRRPRAPARATSSGS